MTSLVTICDCLSVIAGIAGFFLAVLFLVVTQTRKSSLAWINLLFIGVVLIVSSECLANLSAGQTTLPPEVLLARILVSLAMLTCAILSVPLYRRVRQHPQYDELQAANRQLEYTKGLFKSFLDETPFAVYVADADDRFLYVNDRIAKNHQVRVDEMIGTAYDRWFSSEVAERLRHQNAEIRSVRERREFVNDFEFATGKTTYMSYKFPLPGARDDSLVGVVSLEISDELKAKARDSLLARIVELSPDAIYTISGEYRITSWNRAAERMFGYDCDEIIGQPAAVLMPAGQSDDLLQLLAKVAAGESIKARDFVHVTRDGAVKNITLSATRIKSFMDAGASYAVIARDETETLRAAEELKELTTELDYRADVLSLANEALPVARDQALEALALRSAFVANMSHAIRTPLSGILGMSELLLDKPFDSGTQEIVETILESGEALLTIVNDILDLSRLENESADLDNKPFSPGTLVVDCVKLVQPGAAGKGLKLSVMVGRDVPDKVIGDPSRIRQTLLNLLGNAVKFTPSGEVSIDVSVISETADIIGLRFAVTDTGIGIASEDAALLFTPFSRIEKSSKGIRGSGLGLSISKRLVALLEGDIQFESTENGGSRFWVDLPLKKIKQGLKSKASEAGNAVSPEEARLLSSARVLVVEDNAVIATLTLRQLQKFGVSADYAMSGKAALERVQATKYDIVLMDVNLPDMSGYEVTESIRQSESGGKLGGASGGSDEPSGDEQAPGEQRCIIIAVTAGAMPGDRELAIRSGMDDYLAKPVEPLQLRRRLLDWLERGRDRGSDLAPDQEQNKDPDQQLDPDRELDPDRQSPSGKQT